MGLSHLPGAGGRGNSPPPGARMASPCRVETLPWLPPWMRPRRREIHVSNTTGRSLIIVLMPPTSSSMTSWLERELLSRVLQIQDSHPVQRDDTDPIEPEAHVVVHLTKGDGGSETLGTNDPGSSIYCSFSEWTWSYVKMVLITRDEERLHIWHYSYVEERSRVTVLPTLFPWGMSPTWGSYRRDDTSNDPVGLGPRVRRAIMDAVEGSFLNAFSPSEQGQPPIGYEELSALPSPVAVRASSFEEEKSRSADSTNKVPDPDVPITSGQHWPYGEGAVSGQASTFAFSESSFAEEKSRPDIEVEIAPDVESTAEQGEGPGQRRAPGRASLLGATMSAYLQDETVELVSEGESMERKTFSLVDEAVRLNVDSSCCPEGQSVGPVSARSASDLVLCEGRFFLASIVVDFRPCGITFDQPLVLDFRVGEDAAEEWGDGESGDEIMAELEAYKQSLRDVYKILWREGSQAPWQLIDQDETRILHEDGKFFVRARVHHFSQGCLAANINMQCAYHEEVMLWRHWARPRKGEIQYMNATDRPLIILVMPITFSNNLIRDARLGLEGAGVGINVEISRALQQAILPEGTRPQIHQLPRRDGAGSPKAGDPCPFFYCSFSRCMQNEAKVALITADEERIRVWDNRIVKGRTRIVVLPRQFPAGMRSVLGDFKRSELPGRLTDLQVALIAVVKVEILDFGDLSVRTDEVARDASTQQTREP